MSSSVPAVIQTDRRDRRARRDAKERKNMDSGVETGNDSNDSLVTHCENIANMPVVGTSSQMQCFFSNNNNAIMPLQSVSENVQEDASSQLKESSSVTSQELVPSNSIVSVRDSGPHFSLTFFSNDSDKTLELQFPPMSLYDSYPTKPCYIGKIKPIFSYKNWKLNYRKEKTSLRIAARTNDLKMMKRLLEEGVSPNKQDCMGRTPLHVAASSRNIEMVKLLLSYGANPNLKDCIGNTPLHLAIVSSDMRIVNTLLSAGTDVLSADCHGHNPLQLAQTKLRVLQNCKISDMNRVKEEARDVITMLRMHLQKQKDAREQVEALSTLCSRLSLSSTTEQVQDEVRCLLANIDSLSLTN